MPLALSPVPAISISLASPEEPAKEPFSPFSQCSFLSDDSDSFRPALLSPPPPPIQRKNLSPLRPDDAPVTGKGLERERFDALLRATKERNSAIGSKRPATDLRKEIALKVHSSKAAERRALFLSKVQAPPSPSAMFTPVTPPESPAIFHYTLPSPGLESPLEMFEALSIGNGKTSAELGISPWVEQVDFRLPGELRSKPLKSAPVLGRRKAMPSLDQISARLSGHVTPSPQTTAPQGGRLPSFLRKPAQEPPVIVVEQAPAAPRTRPALTISVGRLQFPKRSEQQELKSPQPVRCVPPVSPCSPKLQITTTVVPRTQSSSPVELTESNLHAFMTLSRENTSRNMLTRLRRRTLPPKGVNEPVSRVPSVPTVEEESDRKSRRHSAPPELQPRARVGFTHPVLQLPGAF